MVVAWRLDWPWARADDVGDDLSQGIMIERIVAFLLLYACLIRSPSAVHEIGIALLMLRGETVAPLCRPRHGVAGLALAYGCGGGAELPLAAKGFRRSAAASRLSSHRAQRGAMGRADRLALLRHPPCPAWLSKLGRSRPVCQILALLLKPPRNGLIGGGGGIADGGGAHRLFSPG